MDFDAFSRLVDEHGTALYRFCLKLSPNDADDLYQETFIRIWERRRRLDERNIKSYLFTVCVNLWRSSLRKGLHKKLVSIEEVYNLPSPDEPLEVKLENEEDALRLRQMIEKLDIKYRLPLYMFYTSEMKVKEIAKALSIPAGTVKSRLHKARAMLKKNLTSNIYHLQSIKEASDYE